MGFFEANARGPGGSGRAHCVHNPSCLKNVHLTAPTRGGSDTVLGPLRKTCDACCMQGLSSLLGERFVGLGVEVAMHLCKDQQKHIKKVHINICSTDSNK